jgi:hypothetical protein
MLAHHFDRLPAIRDDKRAKLPHIFRQDRPPAAF